MKIESITAHYSLTQSLSGYCNVKPGLSAIAVLEEGDDPGKALEQLLETLKPKVQAEVDEALEQDGQPPKYYDGPRYMIRRVYGYILILPDGTLPESIRTFSGRTLICERRLETCQEIARAESIQNVCYVVECLDGKVPEEVLKELEARAAMAETDAARERALREDQDHYEEDWGDDDEDDEF